MSDVQGSVLILAPSGRDAEVAAVILAEERITSRVCHSLPELVAGHDAACCAVVTEEALLAENRQALADWIAQQPPWSDFPFILLTLRGAEPDPRLTETLGNVSLLERPFHPATLVMAVRFAYRGRRRQHQAKVYLEERERTAERQTLLIRELHHRVKNTLATVQGLLGASARSATSVENFYSSFSARIISLAKTHNLLTEDYWQQASLREMLENELGPYNDAGGTRIQLDGPRIELIGDLAVPTGMAIHELATNAAKHGALSVPEGRIKVTWDVRCADTKRILALDWRELGGPLVQQPTRKGFGSTLLQRVLKVQCEAEIAFDFQSSGLHFRMEAPVPDKRAVPSY
ncbi:sensor histidine kinase [Methylobacterium nigriterrae]|uniref:sensor histidine kinase n=1 Tax=Methylobacterium nigriterrae TaxID=3127512 RepID=UPI0030140D14